MTQRRRTFRFAAEFGIGMKSRFKRAAGIFGIVVFVIALMFFRMCRHVARAETELQPGQRPRLAAFSLAARYVRYYPKPPDRPSVASVMWPEAEQFIRDFPELRWQQRFACL